MTERSQTSPWIYIGVGCLLAVLLVVGSCVAIGWFGIEKAREMAEEMTDPEKREAKVLATLGAEELPPGYYAVMGMSMPLGVMEMAMLSDEPPREDAEGRSVPGELGRRGLVYVTQRDFGNGREQLSAYLRGESEDRGPLKNIQTNVDFDRRELLGRGEIEVEGTAYLYATYAGSVSMSGHEDVDAVTTVFQPLCADDKVRSGIWWVPRTADPDPEGDVEASGAAGPDPSGAPADPEALRELIGYFDLCG